MIFNDHVKLLIICCCLEMKTIFSIKLVKSISQLTTWKFMLIGYLLTDLEVFGW